MKIVHRSSFIVHRFHVYRRPPHPAWHPRRSHREGPSALPAPVPRRPARDRGAAPVVVVRPEPLHPPLPPETVGRQVPTHLGREDRLAAAPLDAPPGRGVAKSAPRR